MNNFEEFTVIIGALAILFEAIRHLKGKIREWWDAAHHITH